MKHIIRFISVLILIAAVSACGGSGDKYTKLRPENGSVSIPVSKVSDGNAHYYTVNSGGKEIKFFLIKSGDGVIRAAFDACDVCYPEKKGYRQEGEYMVCNNCGQKFHSSRINEVRGGCNPSPLAREKQGENIIIFIKDIESGAFYF